MKTYQINELQRGFGSQSFRSLIKNDTLAAPDRYASLYGVDTQAVTETLDWYFVDLPVMVSLSTNDGSQVALAFAAPICFKASKNKVHGINLSYSVHSEFEGRGLGLAAASLAITEADNLWRQHLTGTKMFLNIQTLASNASSLRLLNRLTLPGEMLEACTFDVKTNLGKTVQYVGARSQWHGAVSRAEQHLLNIPFLKEANGDKNLNSTESDTETEDFSCSPTMT